MLLRPAAIALGGLLGLANAIGIEKGSLRTNAQTNPIAVDNTTPRLTWRLTSDVRADKQTAYHVQVSSSESFDDVDLWDSGKVESEWAWTVYDGKALKSRDAAFWRIKVWDAENAVSDWSDPATFEVSLLDADDWSAEWIKNPNHVNGVTSLPRFAKVFSVDCPVEKARLYILGLGLHHPLINNKLVSDDVMQQGYATLNKTLLYSTYDVLDTLKKGKNLLAVELGKGVYDSTVPVGGRYTKFRQAPRDLMLLAQLEYTCEDGSVEKVYTGEDWVTTVEGPWLEAHWYGGEEYDSRKENKLWGHLCGDRSDWANAVPAVPPHGKLVSPRAPPLKITESFTAKSVWQADNGQWVFDLGTNIAGIFTFKIKGHGDKAGTRITFWPGESAGRSSGVSQTSTGTPIYNAYTLSDSDDQEYTPRYIYHGHQFLGVNLTWTPQASDLVGSVVRANNEQVLSLSTSNQLFNDIHKIIDRSIQGNMHSVLTDCPHREKWGWNEQDHLVFDPLTFNYDFQAYGDDLIRTFADAQAKDVPGLIPATSPEYNIMGGGYRNDPNWGSAMVWVPLKLYRMYGDINILKVKHQEMIDYVGYLMTRAAGRPFLDDGGLGDWLSLELRPVTPKGVSSTFGYHGAALAMSEVEEILGNAESAKFYADLAHDIREGFHGRWFNATAASPYYCENTQGCNAFALGMQAVPGAARADVVDSLIGNIRQHNYTMRIGEIALPSMFRELQAHGRDDVIYNIMNTEEQWGYGYMVRQGATSLWEHWDLPVTGGSRNHFMFGYGDGWLIQLAGMWQLPGSVAWKQIEYRPIVVGDLTSASTGYRTPHGHASAAWEKSGREIAYEITVPVGSTGKVVLAAEGVKEGGEAVVEGKNGVISVGEEDGQAVVVVGSGTYSFTATLI